MVDAHGISVDFDCRYQVLSVRYFDAAAVSVVGRLKLPEPLRVVQDADALLAWRSPTESLFLTHERARIEEVEAEWRDSVVGCCILQTDGICIMRVKGARLAELLQRLGAASCIPDPGEARTSRIGDLPVTAINVADAVILLAVERVYAAHLQTWLESTLVDL